jgi:hypothetical protein
VYQRYDFCLQPISQKLCDNLKDIVEEGDGPKITGVSWVVNFWDQSDEGEINSFQIE